MSVKHIENLYKNLTYFDQYGGSVITFVLITLVYVVLCSYCYVMINAKEIRNNWQTEKCKPQIMPFAGFINAPKGTSWSEYTLRNFQQCLNNVQSGLAGEALEPITFITNIMSSMISEIKTSINGVRAMFDKVRSFFESVTKEIMGRLMNIMIPLQQIIIAVKDIFSKVQGVMTAGLFTVLGAFYTLQSLMGAIAEFIITILITLAVIIMVLWAVPFTWGAAGAMTAIFMGISIPMIVILAFMLDKLKVRPDLSIPKIKCFDKNTKLMLNDGTIKQIMDVRVGDTLLDNVSVTAVIKVTSENSTMYSLNDIIVSDSHLVKYNNIWTNVSNHPESRLVNDYKEPFLYCINTDTKSIKLNDTCFADWDDLYDTKLGIFLRKQHLNNCSDIHKCLDGGFSPSTRICLENGEHKEIKDVNVGDVLIGHVVVYGIVKIDGTNIDEQYKLSNLGNRAVINGGGRLHITTSASYNKRDIVIKHDILYHLLTNTNMFVVKNVEFYDYNACIDFLH